MTVTAMSHVTTTMSNSDPSGPIPSRARETGSNHWAKPVSGGDHPASADQDLTEAPPTRESSVFAYPSPSARRGAFTRYGPVFGIFSSAWRMIWQDSLNSLNRHTNRAYESPAPPSCHTAVQSRSPRTPRTDRGDAGPR